MGMALGPKSDDTVFWGEPGRRGTPLGSPAEAPPDLLPARGGVVRVRLTGDRVILSGQAVMRGELVA